MTAPHVLVAEKVPRGFGRARWGVFPSFVTSAPCCRTSSPTIAGLGVDEFFIVDNGSDDGSWEWLAAQPDVALYPDPREVLRVQLRDRLGQLAHRRARDRPRCCFVDADEHLVYRDCERQSLPAYVADLDRAGAGGLFAFMLDFYPGGHLGTRARRRPRRRR